MRERSGADMLAAWLAEDRANRGYREPRQMSSDMRTYRCLLYDHSMPVNNWIWAGFGPTPAAAMRAAVEKARSNA